MGGEIMAEYRSHSLVQRSEKNDITGVGSIHGIADSDLFFGPNFCRPLTT